MSKAPTKQLGPREHIQDEIQKVVIGVRFTRTDSGLFEAFMDVEYSPKMPMLDPHKKDYGVAGVQACAARLPEMVEHVMTMKGIVVDHPGKANKV